jgi:hypothetical protein
MSAWERDIPWRQGHVLPDEAVRSFLGDLPGIDVVIVVSHDCDIAQPPSLESVVEVIPGRFIGAVDGNFTYAKNARRLHLTLSGGTEQVNVDLEASRKLAITKEQLREYRPVEAVRATTSELRILQRWLAARYRRAAFPDEFDRRLVATGLRDQLSRIFKAHGSLISAIFFDLDSGEEVSRSGPNDPYRLAIYLLYNSETNPDDAEGAAAAAKLAIETVFRNKCFLGETGEWNNIELIECEAVSDQAMTVQHAESLKRWSADHLSLRVDPPQSILRNE